MEYNNSFDDKCKEKKLEINFCIDENKINKIDKIDKNINKNINKNIIPVKNINKNINKNIIPVKNIIENINKNKKNLSKLSSTIKNNEEIEKLCDDTSDSEDEVPKKKPKISTKNISTEGIKYNTQEYHQHKNNIKICDCCHLHFNLNMLADTEFGSMCQHCYFFLNFTNPESKYGWTLESYVELCKKDHDTQKCEKFKNSGTCHLCFALLDTQSIQNTQKKEEEKKTVKYTEPEKIHIDSDDDICI